MNLYDVIVRPLITEKGTRQQTLANEYFFEVARKANKNQICKAVEKLFKVKVLGVRTLTARGSLKKTAKRLKRTPDWKKAIVTLQKGDKIELFQSAKT